jgi:uncharacterized protein (TIGR02145 family)
MPVPVNNLRLSDIQTELGGSALQVSRITELFNYTGVIESGLDPAYCNSLIDLRTKPLRIGKFRNYTTPVEYRECYGLLYDIWTLGYGGIIAPEGWRVPTEVDWLDLSIATGVNDFTRMHWLRSARIVSPTPHPRWLFGSADPANLGGFNALPSGVRSRLDSSGGPTYIYTGHLGIYAIYWVNGGGLSDIKSIGFYSSQSGSLFSVINGYWEDLGHTIRLVKNDMNDTGIVTDIDGNSYPTATIGNRVWMCQDLKVTRYRNGNPIAYKQSHEEWEVKGITGSYCHQ